MDLILDNLGIVSVGVIYFLGWLFNKNAKADETTPEPLHDRDVDTEENDYQRNIQSRDNTQPIIKSGRQNPTPIPNLSRQYQQVTSEGLIDSSWEQSDDDPYDNKIESQLKKIEATEREVSRLQAQSTQKLIHAKGKIDTPPTTRKKSSIRSVRSSLKDPKVARSAFIYGEVLGPPVSLRKG